MSVFVPLTRFVQLPDETNPGVIQAICLFCNRMIAASREKKVLEIAQRIHTCPSLTAASDDPQSNQFSN
jgi:hypothetical protein